MTEPPPPPPEPVLGGFHLPRTNLFFPVRAQLTALEHPPQFKSDLEVPLAFLIAFVTGGLLGVIFPLAINTAFSSALGDAARWATPVLVAPVTEETSKGLCMLVVAYAIARVHPNRRYGAAIGAATGLGFAIMEDIVFAVQGQTPGIFGLVRLVETPVTHPLFSSFVGLGVFVFVSKIRTGKTVFEAAIGLPIIFLVIGMLNHSFWNAIAVSVPFPGSMVVAMFVFSPIFVVILRDFLGGHFNFQHFFEPLPEPPRPYWATPPPPTEPPPP